MTRMVAPFQRNREGSATGARHSRTDKRHLCQAAIRGSLQKLEMPPTWLELFLPLAWIGGTEWGTRPETGSAYCYRLHQAENRMRGVVPPL
jgi:hypothetical protein